MVVHFQDIVKKRIIDEVLRSTTTGFKVVITDSSSLKTLDSVMGLFELMDEDVTRKD